jgi:hypothetical protein
MTELKPSEEDKNKMLDCCFYKYKHVYILYVTSQIGLVLPSVIFQ